MENIIVIGGGLMGSAAAWQLSQAGEKVLLIEQQGVEYTHGSSYGESRITRSLGPKWDIFSFVQRTTVEEVRKLIRFLNGPQTPKKHRMKDIYTTSPVTYLYHQSQQDEIDQFKYKGQKDKYKQAFGKDAFRKFGMTVPDSYVVIREYKKYSGTFNPKVLIDKLRLGIQKHGNPIRYHQKAVRVIRKTGHYEVNIEDTKTGQTETLLTKKVVVAAGPYNAKVLKKIAPYFKKIITPKKVLVSFFKINKKKYQSFTNAEIKRIRNAHPVFDQNDSMYFAMLEKTDTDDLPIFKVGGHDRLGNISDLDKVWQEKPNKKEKKWAKKSFKNYFKMLQIPLTNKDIERIHHYTCVYSMSATKLPFVTNIFTKQGTTDTGIVVIGGMSGVGAKGCLAYGLLATDLLLGRSDTDKMYQKASKELQYTWREPK